MRSSASQPVALWASPPSEEESASPSGSSSSTSRASVFTPSNETARLQKCKQSLSIMRYRNVEVAPETEDVPLA